MENKEKYNDFIDLENSSIWVLIPLLFLQILTKNFTSPKRGNSPIIGQDNPRSVKGESCHVITWLYLESWSNSKMYKTQEAKDRSEKRFDTSSQLTNKRMSMGTSCDW